MQHRDIGRRNVVSVTCSDAFQVRKNFGCLLFAAGRREYRAQRRASLRGVAHHFDGVLRFDDGFVVAPQLEIRPAEKIMRRREVGIHLVGLLQMLYGLVESPRPVVMEPKVRTGEHRDGEEIGGFPGRLDGFLVAAHCRKVEVAHQERLLTFGIEFQRALQRLLGAVPVEIVPHAHNAQRGVRIRECLV